jgi:2-polyprenyl-6-methoxyphenol hydroxylase-like FAD-dependent oxidoreductase
MKIAIVGGGVNGLALYLFLKKFDLSAAIYEQEKEPRVDGTGICVWTEGVQILAGLSSVGAVKKIINP